MNEWVSCGKDLLPNGDNLLSCWHNLQSCRNDLLSCENDLLSHGNKIKMIRRQFDVTLYTSYKYTVKKLLKFWNKTIWWHSFLVEHFSASFTVFLSTKAVGTDNYNIG